MIPHLYLLGELLTNVFTPFIYHFPCQKTCSILSLKSGSFSSHIYFLQTNPPTNGEKRGFRDSQFLAANYTSVISKPSLKVQPQGRQRWCLTCSSQGPWILHWHFLVDFISCFTGPSSWWKPPTFCYYPVLQVSLGGRAGQRRNHALKRVSVFVCTACVINTPV